MSSNWLKELNLKPRSNSVKTFKSYVDLESKDEEKCPLPQSDSGDVPQKEKETSCASTSYLQPSLLPGEVVIAEAENVLKFNTLSELNKGISGALFCTNFKLSFMTAETFPSNLHQRNILLGENDICLINIDVLYHVVGGKRKKLSSTSNYANIEVLEVHCKDLRIYTFSFKFSSVKQRSVINTILLYAFVPRINLLFAFDYKEPASSSESTSNHSLLFTRPSDWEAELSRCRCNGWRVTQANEKFLLCDSLPESFVVPSILLDMNLNKTAPHFSGHRVPTWSWGLPSGASIVRMASLDTSISDSQQKDVMVDAISRASPRQLRVRIFGDDEPLPGPKDIQTSFSKLKDLCTPSNPQEFWETDSHFLSNLEATKWLHYVSTCLSTALEAAQCISENTTVIFLEHEGRDLSCVLSSLVQILLDPFYRKFNGFQQLIQKEWVALGHPFTERHKLISGFEGEESPVFLLFLDCVWQLSQQCPTVFEFSETYLTTLWDGCHVSIFDTFLFSSHKNRSEALFSVNNFCLRNIWQWSKQFSKNDCRLFNNPLYILNKYRATKPQAESGRPRSLTSLKDPRQRSVLTEKNAPTVVWDDDEENLLKIDPFIKSLHLWHQCYLRWVPLAHILGGGPPVLFLTNTKIADEIVAMEEKLKALTMKSRPPKPPGLHRRAASDDYTISADIINNCQIPVGSSIVTSVFPFAPVAPWDWSSFHFVPSTTYLQISYTESEEVLDD